MDDNNNSNDMHDYNHILGCDCEDIDVCDHSTCTFDFDLNFKCWDDMRQQLLVPSIDMRYINMNSNTIATKAQEKEISRLKEEYRMQLKLD